MPNVLRSLGLALPSQSTCVRPQLKTGLALPTPPGSWPKPCASTELPCSVVAPRFESFGTWNGDMNGSTTRFRSGLVTIFYYRQQVRLYIGPWSHSISRSRDYGCSLALLLCSLIERADALAIVFHVDRRPAIFVWAISASLNAPTLDVGS